MSSKVTCTCGHSWNKKDSSKKDVNVCHICGKDNTMKDGGWLSKYDDGGPVQENYNDASATEGPDYVGAGYDIIGRNYSPAWGGQFQWGGSPNLTQNINMSRPHNDFGFPTKEFDPFYSFPDVEKKDTSKTLKINDSRKKLSTTNQPVRPNSDLVGGKYNTRLLDSLIEEAKKQKMSKEDIKNLSAMAFQETKWGKTDDNLGHVLDNFPGKDSNQQFINAYKEKMKVADRLHITDPNLRLQVYNGLGTVTPKTEKNYHGFEMQKIYGVPIPKEGINMRKNPLYGKQIADIRDNVLAKNPEYTQYLDSIYKAPPVEEKLTNFQLEKLRNKEPLDTFQHGGTLPGATGHMYARYESGGSMPGDVGFSFPRTKGIPSNGPYAKKTKASAQDGTDVKQDNNEWLTNWYKNRKIPNEQLQSIYEADKPYYLDRLQNIPEVTNVESIDNNPYKTGQYQHDTNKILLTPNAEDNVYLHELSHYADDFPSAMRPIHGNITKTNVAPKEGMKGIYNEKYNYFSDPEEVHSRIQVLRKEAGFKPDEEVTPETLDKFIKNYKGDNGNINDLFNIADPSHLLEMLNYMAANKSNKNSSTAQNGREMQFYQNGLDWKPKSISEDGDEIKKGTAKPTDEYWRNNIYKGPKQFEECRGEGCSKQATKSVANLYGLNYDDLNPQDAWYKRAAVIKGGGQEIYNRNQGDLKSKYGDLRVGDFISLDREGSPHASDKSKIPGYNIDDNEKTEHLGYVVGFDKDGTPLVKHGHEGNVLQDARSYIQRLDSDIALPELGLHYNVASIYRPEKLMHNNEIINTKYYKDLLPTKNLTFVKGADVTEDKQKFINAYNKNSQAFQEESGLNPDQVAAIGNVAYGIFGNESSFNSMTSPKTITTPYGSLELDVPNKNAFRVPKQIAGELADAFGLKDSSPSLGPTQLKYKDAKKNKDNTLTGAGKLMEALNVTGGGMGSYSGTNYDAVTKGTFAALADKYKKLTTNPKFEYNPENNTVFGNVPLGYALAKSWQNPSLKNMKKTLQRNDSDYSKSAYENMSELEGNVFPVTLPEVVVTPESNKKNGGWLSKYEEGGVIEDDRGQWEYPGEITKINSNQITMQGVDYPVLGISDTGDTQMMQPGEDYTYDGESVTEYPMMQNGGERTLDSSIKETDKFVKERAIRNKAISDNQSAWNINDYTKYGLKEPGLETPIVDPIDFASGSLLKSVPSIVSKSIGLHKAFQPIIHQGFNLGAHPKTIARASRALGKQLGIASADALEILTGTNNDYSLNKKKNGGWLNKYN